MKEKKERATSKKQMFCGNITVLCTLDSEQLRMQKLCKNMSSYYSNY